MDFHEFATAELTSIAKKLADAAATRVREEVDAAAKSHAAFNATIEKLRNDQTELLADNERLAAENAAAAKSHAAFTTTIEKLRNDQTELVADNERLAAENATLIYERAAMLEGTPASQGTPLATRLASAFHAMAAARAVESVLSATVSELVEFPRVAVFAARDSGFVSIFQRGFDPASGIETLTVPAGGDSFLSAAAHSAGVTAWRGSEAGASSLGGVPTLVVMAPIVVRGDTIAVLYGDDEGQPSDVEVMDERIQLAGVLAAHAALRLEQLTVELKAVAELRAYAQMLLDEVEYVYDADAGAGKPETERFGRLAENLRCARQIYRQRVTLEGPAAAALLEDVIFRTIDRKSAQPFGRDLGLVVTPALAGASR